MPRFTAGTTTSSSVRRTVGHGSSSMAGYAIGFGPSSTNAGRAVEVRAVGVDTLIIAGEMTTSPSTASSTFRVPLSSSDSPEQDHQLESRMREIRQSGSEGGGGREVSPYPNLTPFQKVDIGDRLECLLPAGWPGGFQPPKLARRAGTRAKGRLCRDRGRLEGADA